MYLMREAYNAKERILGNKEVAQGSNMACCLRRVATKLALSTEHNSANAYRYLQAAVWQLLCANYC